MRVACILVVVSRCGGEVDGADASVDAANDTMSCPVPCSAVAPSSASCIDGRCVVTLAANASQPWQLVVDSTHVYWIDRGLGIVEKVPLGGGASTTLASGTNGYSLAMGGDSLYWNDPTSGVMKGSKNGGAAVQLAVPNMEYGEGIAVDATSVYWTDSYSPGAVKKVSRDGGVVSTLASNLSQPEGIAVDSTSLYWTTFDGTLTTSDLNGANMQQLTTGSPSAVGLAIDAANVYWTTSNAVMQIPRGGGQALTVASDQNAPYAVAVDDANVYWVGNEFAIKKAPIGGGPVTTLVGARGEGIAVDGTSVYWTDNDQRAVMKVTPK